MPPRKQPASLFNICVRSTINVINSACCAIEKRYAKSLINECEKEALQLKMYLMSVIPVKIFDILCSERKHCTYRGDTRLQLLVLMHNDMTVFRRSDEDRRIPELFWINNLPNLTRLVVLDLKHICTDTILEVVANNCPLIEDINIVSYSDEGYNSDYVSDTGLSYLRKLRQLRILEIDTPDDLITKVTTAGVIAVIKDLPYLEELRTPNYGILDDALLSAQIEGPLRLNKIVGYQHDYPDGITRLSKLCPCLQQLTVYRCTDYPSLLQQIIDSDWKLKELAFRRISFTDKFLELLKCKGMYLTHLSLWRIYNINFNALLLIGEYCPHLHTLCVNVSINSSGLVVPGDYKKTKQLVFLNLKNLKVRNNPDGIENIIIFFVECTRDLKKLAINCRSTDFDEVLMFLLYNEYLKSIEYLELGMELYVSKNAIMRVIEMCENLQTFIVDCGEPACDDVHSYIKENNLDIKLYINKKWEEHDIGGYKFPFTLSNY